jgi:hypothetical protein
MKKYIMVFLTFLLFSCATAGTGRYLTLLADAGEWMLAKISADGKTVTIDREQLGAFDDAFSLRVSKTDDSGGYLLSGKAAPNRFNMPVKAGENGELAVSPPAATLMAAFMEPGVLKEHEYLQYLANIRSVQMSGGRLILETADADGQPVSLAFVPFASRE